MGSPKSKKQQKSSSVTREELKSPSVREKIRLLNVGREIRMEVIFELPYIIESMREFLMPLVQWLDVDLTKSRPFDVSSFPTSLDSRAMIVFVNPGEFISFGLCRSGRWIVKEDTTYSWMNSSGLARKIIDKYHDLYTHAVRDLDVLDLTDSAWNKTFERIIKNEALIWLVNECWKKVDEQLSARESRLKLMRERVDVFKDFGPSLDPLISRGRTLKIPSYCIYRLRGDGGTDNEVCTYLCKPALQPFWEVIKRRVQTQTSKSRFWTERSVYEVRSISELLGRIGYLAREISNAKEGGRTDASSQFGFNSGRLPFSQEELDILENLFAAVVNQ